MKTFWLYSGERVIGGFRCKTDATPQDVRTHAAMQFNDNPFFFNAWVTLGTILTATVKE